MYIISVLLSAPHSTANRSMWRLGLKKINLNNLLCNHLVPQLLPQICVMLIKMICILALCFHLVLHFRKLFLVVPFFLCAVRETYISSALFSMHVCVNQYLMYPFSSFSLSNSQSNALFIKGSYLL